MAIEPDSLSMTTAAGTIVDSSGRKLNNVGRISSTGRDILFPRFMMDHGEMM
jgi:hypothetical protein